MVVLFSTQVIGGASTRTGKSSSHERRRNTQFDKIHAMSCLGKLWLADIFSM